MGYGFPVSPPPIINTSTVVITESGKAIETMCDVSLESDSLKDRSRYGYNINDSDESSNSSSDDCSQRKFKKRKTDKRMKKSEETKQSDESNDSGSSSDESSGRKHKKRKNERKEKKKRKDKKKKDNKKDKKDKKKKKDKDTYRRLEAKPSCINQNEYGKYGIIREEHFFQKQRYFYTFLGCSTHVTSLTFV